MRIPAPDMSSTQKCASTWKAGNLPFSTKTDQQLGFFFFRFIIALVRIRELMMSLILRSFELRSCLAPVRGSSRSQKLIKSGFVRGVLVDGALSVVSKMVITRCVPNLKF